MFSCELRHNNHNICFTFCSILCKIKFKRKLHISWICQCTKVCLKTRVVHFPLWHTSSTRPPERIFKERIHLITCQHYFYSLLVQLEFRLHRSIFNLQSYCLRKKEKKNRNILVMGNSSRYVSNTHTHVTYTVYIHP